MMLTVPLRYNFGHCFLNYDRM